MKLRVATICYAIEAGRGSEEGSGYNYCRTLAQDEGIELTIVTRRNNVAPLRTDSAFVGVRVIGYDPPAWMTFWKRGGRGITLFYYLWQIGVARVVKRTDAIDVIHQYNFHTDTTPHFHRSERPVIWGPICHQPQLPDEYFLGLPLRNRVRDRLKWSVKRLLWQLDPSLRQAIARSSVILYANEHVAPPFQGRPVVRTQTFGGSNWPATGNEPRPTRTALRLIHVGRSVEIKGAHLALRAFAAFLGTGRDGQLDIIGQGPLEGHLRSLALELHVADKVHFHNWMPQSEIVVHYQEADALLYPSQGNQDSVVAEALATSLPVVCLRGTGTEFMAGPAAVTSPSPRSQDLVTQLTEAILMLDDERRHSPSQFSARREQARLRTDVVSWHGTASAISQIYREVSQ